MAKQLKANLVIGANTEKAKAAIQDLGSSLQKIQTMMPSGGLIDDVSIRRASQAASELQQHLNAAVNVDTGKLDLNRFSHSLKSSGKDLKSYYDALVKIGPAGEQAFLKLSRSIATAETSTVRVNKKMQEFATTLKNTARWQISSSVLHGLMGGVQQAYSYAKDLDAALNDIRIVTGKNADAMDDFAVKANRAAQALSTSTVEYAKASLIYYQQGLSGSDVEDRANITVKMANAAGVSAETVSDQLTAVWNNFYDGSQSLEHFADVMVRLGADTASSSDEIAEGLEKFASIGEMIGLSYDNAAAALATVTATTRQSADVVGTAYKTIFARMQGLQLGETLDDGTTLNKYSEALAKVGISIKDQNGAIKDMDLLIAEMGAKWQTISKDQQIALAQAVGGVRQYNQIVSLMDNFDFYEENLASAQNADGALDIQAKIYAESWEAARERVDAAAEGIYDSLLNEDFFIGFDDTIATLLNGVEGLVDGLGGMTGVIALIGSLITRHFAKEAPAALKNLKENIQGILGIESKESKALQSDNNAIMDSAFDTTDTSKRSRNVDIEGTKALNQMTQQLNENQRKLSEEERKAYEEKIKIVQTTYDLIAADAKELENAEKKTAELEEQIAKAAALKKIREEAENGVQRNEGESDADFKNRRKQAGDSAVEDAKTRKGKQRNSKASDEAKKIKAQSDALKKLIKDSEKYERIQRNMQKQAKSWTENAKAIKQSDKETENLRKNMLTALQAMQNVDKTNEDFRTLVELLDKGEGEVDDLIKKFSDLSGNSDFFAEADAEIDGFMTRLEGAENELRNLGLSADDINSLEEQFRMDAQGAYDLEDSLVAVGGAADELPSHTVGISEGLMQVGSAGMALVGVASSMQGMFDVFGDDQATGIQKVGAAIGFAMSMLSGFSATMEAVNTVQAIFNTLKNAGTAATAANTAAQGANAVGQGVNAAAQGAVTAATGTQTAAIWANTAAWFSNPITAIIAVALLAVVAAVSAVSGAMEANTKKNKENAEASKEVADNLYEEVQANNELMSSYEQTLQAYKEGKSSKEDLAAATEALLEVYAVENADLLIAAGNYDALTAAIKRAEQAKLDQAKMETSLAVADAEQVFQDQMRDGTGNFSGGNYNATIGGGWDWGDESEVQNAMNDLLANGDLTSGGITTNGGEILIQTGQSHEDLIAVYEDMQKAQAYLKSNIDDEILQESENYQNMVDWLAKSQEAYANVVALQEQLESVSVQRAASEVIANAGAIESMDDYKAAEKALTDQLLADQDMNLDANNAEDVQKAQELAQAALAQEEAFAKMATHSKLISQAVSQTGDKISEESMLEFFNSLSEDEQALFASLNFDSATSVENLEEQLDVLRARAEQATIKTNLEAVENAQGLLKEDMGAEDYKTFESDSGLAWGEDGIVEYSDFLRMTYEEQSNYLSDLNEQYTKELKTSTDNLISENQERIAAINKQLPEIEDNLSEFESAITKDLDDTAKSELLKKAQGLDASSGTYQTDLSNLASEYGIDAEAIQSYRDAYNQTVALKNEVNTLNTEIEDLNEQAEIDEILNFAQTKEDLQALQTELSELEIGDTIDADMYDMLLEKFPELAKNFEKTADGSYQLTDGLNEVNGCWREMSELTSDSGEKYFNQQDIANMITSVDDLTAAYKEGIISQEVYLENLGRINAAASEAKLAQVESAQGALAEDMDASQYDSLRDSGIDWGNAEEDIMEYSDFVRMEYAAQKDYLESLNNRYREETIQAYQDAKNAVVDALNEERSAISDLEEELNSEDITEERKIEIETEITGRKEEIEKLENQIEDLDLEIDIAVKLDQDGDFKQLISDLEDIKGINDTVDKSIKKVGSNYELTAEQAREFANIYPEMLENATVTNEGIVQLNAAEVDEFIKGKEAELIANGEAEIAQLEMEKQVLEAKKAKAQAELELAIAVANGESDITQEQFEWKLSASNALTEALINNGISEADAHMLATAAMAGNEEEFNRIVAEVTANMDENMRNATTAAMQNVYTSMQSAGGDVADFAATCHEAAKAFAGIGDGEVQGSATNQVGGGAGSTNFDAKINYSTGSFNGSEYSYDMQEMTLGDFIADRELDISNYDSAIGEINTRIAEIRAGMAKSLNSYTPGTSRPSDDGGGGGGSDDKDKAKDIEELEELAERYHEITREIEYQNHVLTQLGKEKDKAFGKKKIDLIRQEGQALKELADKEQELLDLQTGFLAIDQAAVLDTFANADFDPESQEIVNYTQLAESALKELNDAKLKYNASAQEDADKQALSDAQDKYDNQMKVLEQYEETLDAWRAQQEKVTDANIAMLDNALEEVQEIVTIKLDVANENLEYLDFLLTKIGDSAYDAAEAIAVLGSKTQQSLSNIETYKKGISDIFANHGFSQEDIDSYINGKADADTIARLEGADFTADEVAAIREYKSGIIEENEALLELQETVRGKIMESFEELTGEMDEQIEKIDKLGQMTQNYRDIIDIVGQDYLGISDDLMNSLNAAKVQTAMDGITATQAKLDAMKAGREDAQRKLAEAEAAGLSDTADFWRDTIEEMDKQIDDATLEVQDKLKVALEAIAEQFDETVQRAADSFKDAMAGAAGSMELLQARMDRASQVRERYIPEYEKVYELSKLTRDINNSIDDTDNIRAKKELMKLMEEINEIQESGAELSEYSLQRLQKEYELKQAELALEEAKEAKTQVRMTVDNEGNWGYVYTADDTAVKEAEQNYEDKLYEMESLTQEYLQNLQDMMIQNEIEFAEAVAQIEADRGTKEWYEELERLTAHHKGQQDYYMSEMGIALEDAHEDYNTNAEVYGEATAAKIAADESFVTKFGETQLAVETGFSTMKEYQQAFNDAIGTPDNEESLLGQLTKAYNDWDTKVDEAMKRAGTSVETFGKDMDTAINGEGGIIDQSEAAATKAGELSTAFTTTFGEITSAVQAWELEYDRIIGEALTDTQNLIDKMNALLTVWAGVDEKGGLDTDVPDPTDPTTPTDPGPTDPGPSDPGTKDNSDKIEGVAASIWMQGSDASGWGTGGTRRARFAEKGVSAAQDYINAHAENGDIYRAWHNKRGQLKQYYYGAFDTGGYTGEWGPEGKFAMLHQKEIVLNPSDTENLLSAVNLIREISSIIDLNAMSASHGLSSMLGIGKVGNSRETLEQSVTIHAEFPGVSDRNEIEEAFNNLINTASQYANRKS